MKRNRHFNWKRKHAAKLKARDRLRFRRTYSGTFIDPKSRADFQSWSQTYRPVNKDDLLRWLQQAAPDVNWNHLAPETCGQEDQFQLMRAEQGGCLSAFGDPIPRAGARGLAHGCQFHLIAFGKRTLYINIGDTRGCDFVLPEDIPVMMLHHPLTVSAPASE